MLIKGFRWLNRRAQYTGEYAALLAVIVVAAIAMQVYIRRGVQARIKDAVDFPAKYVNIEGNAFFEGSQYEPYYYRKNLGTIERGGDSEEFHQDGSIVRSSNDSTSSSGNMTYASYLDNSVPPGPTPGPGPSPAPCGGGPCI